MIFSENHTPRWIIFLTDIVICLFSLLLAYLLRFNFSIPEVHWELMKTSVPFVLIVRGISFYITKTYAGVIRYTSTKDAERIFIVVSAGSIFFALFNIVSFRFITYGFIIPYSIVIIDFIVTVFFMTAIRIVVKTLYYEFKNPSRTKRDVIIYGAGEAGCIVKRTLDHDAGSRYKVLLFVDDDRNKAGKKIEGVQIYYFDQLESLLAKNDIAHLIIAMQNISPSRKQEIIEKCLSFNIRVLNIPPVHHWINGELSFRQIKKIAIDDLLERNPIKLDEIQISRHHAGKTVLVTGAAGSIGSELVRQISRYHPAKIVLFDQAETPIYDLELDLSEREGLENITVIIGDITHPNSLEAVFSKYRPQLVYHAAAYKHVPVMECNPSEAVRVNVLGTKLTADLSVKYGVSEFILVSTDKAVNPTNVMGASKRIAEIYCHALSKTNQKTKFVTTRFGNVLGSNGSVLLRFKKQLEQGGPVTITHPDVTRFFMTIPEACQLVLEASTMGKGGEIYVFNMGESVRIEDLAKKMIKLSKLTLGKDIQIRYIGLRPGEKLYEELLTSEENTVPTHHPRIMIARVKEYDFTIISREIEELVSRTHRQDDPSVVGKMKDIVPEFISKNSVFEALDKEKTYSSQIA